mgnify:CR=1 FL=1
MGRARRGAAARCFAQGGQPLLNRNPAGAADDVTDEQQVKDLVARAVEEFGGLNVVVPNAGIATTTPLIETSFEDWRKVMSVNLDGVFLTVRHSLPALVASGGGSIVNISSMLGRLPMATFRSAYCGAKHFVNALTATMRAEVQTTHPGIQITLVSPGGVKTDFGLNARHGGVDSKTLAHFEEPEGVAAAMWEAIETRVPDLYTRSGAKDSVLGYLASLTADPTVHTS